MALAKYDIDYLVQNEGSGVTFVFKGEDLENSLDLSIYPRIEFSIFAPGSVKLVTLDLNSGVNLSGVDSNIISITLPQELTLRMGASTGDPSYELVFITAEGRNLYIMDGKFKIEKTRSRPKTNS